MSDTPIYDEAFAAARDRTEPHSPERRNLSIMDAQTDPNDGPELRRLMEAEETAP